MKKRALSMLMASIVLGTTLAGCAAAPAAAPAAPADTQEAAPAEEAATEAAEAEAPAAEEASGDVVTLKWAMWDATFPYWQDMVDAYEAGHPGVKIEMTDFGSADYDNVLATELSGDGTEFDVVTIKDVPSYASLIEKKAIIPLNDYIEKAGTDLSLYNGATDQVTAADGSLYELPFRSDVWVLFYNKDIFDAAGVDYPTSDMTWEEYDELARKVTNDGFGEEVYGAHYHTWNSTVQFLGNLEGHSILDGNYDYMLPYYNMVLNQEKDGVCQKYSDLKTEGLHYSAAFANGNVAMINMGSWFITTLLSNLSNGEYDPSLCGNWGMVKYPHAEGVEPGTTLGTITGLSVVAASDVQDQAFDFVNWCASEECAEVLAKTGTIPAILNDKISAEIASLEGYPQDDESKAALQTTKVYLEAPYGEKLGEIQSVLGTYHDMIMAGEVTAEEGIASMNSEVAALK